MCRSIGSARTPGAPPRGGRNAPRAERLVVAVWRTSLIAARSFLPLQLNDDLARGLAVHEVSPFGLEGVLVHKREGGIVHVHVLRGLQVRCPHELELDLLAVA